MNMDIENHIKNALYVLFLASTGKRFSMKFQATLRSSLSGHTIKSTFVLMIIIASSQSSKRWKTYQQTSKTSMQNYFLRIWFTQ